MAKDFVDYIMSAEGQDIIEQNGYIKIDQNAAAYAAVSLRVKSLSQVPQVYLRLWKN